MKTKNKKRENIGIIFLLFAIIPIMAFHWIYCIFDGLSHASRFLEEFICDGLVSLADKIAGRFQNTEEE